MIYHVNLLHVRSCLRASLFYKFRMLMIQLLKSTYIEPQANTIQYRKMYVLEGRCCKRQDILDCGGRVLGHVVEHERGDLTLRLREPISEVPAESTQLFERCLVILKLGRSRS